MTEKITKLANIARMAARSYDNGNRETAIKLISLVASKIHTLKDRKDLALLLQEDLKTSGIRTYFNSIIFGSGGTPTSQKTVK